MINDRNFSLARFNNKKTHIAGAQKKHRIGDTRDEAAKRVLRGKERKWKYSIL